VQARSTVAAGFAVLAALATASSAAAHQPDRVTAEVTGTTLAIQGTDRADDIGLVLRGDDLRVELHGRDVRFPHAAIERVTILPGGGEDDVRIDDLADTVFEGVEVDLGADGEADDVRVTGSPGADFADPLHFGATTFVLGLPTFSTIVNPDAGDALRLDTAGGDDRVAASSYPAGALALTLVGGPGDDDLSGGRGADLVLAGPGDDFAAGGGGDDAARLGAGDDLFFWDPGEGSDAVAGQRGSDALSFEGADVPERVDVRAVGRDVRLTRDVGGIVMDLDEVERISTFLRAGADVAAIGDLSGTGMTGSDWGLGALDGAADRLSVDGTRRGDVFAVTGGVQNPQGTSTSAEVRGIPSMVLVTALEHEDELALNGLGGLDVLDDSGLIPGGFALTFVQ
jgi:hypothetical protein